MKIVLIIRGKIKRKFILVVGPWMRLFHQCVFARIAKIYREAIMPELGSLGNGTTIGRGFQAGNSRFLHIGTDCHIGPDCDFSIWSESDSAHGEIVVGDRVWVTKGLQVFVRNHVVIEDDVMIASNCVILDHSHRYDSPYLSYRDQGVSQVSTVCIKRGVWLGQNVVILPGVVVGKGSIIGANSVVNVSIPDYCVAVGAPVRIIKKWDAVSMGWVPV